MYNYGWIPYDGQVEYFKKAAALGHKDATTALGVCYMVGLPGVPQDLNAAVLQFRKGIIIVLFKIKNVHQRNHTHFCILS